MAIEFALFGLTLASVALFHRHTLRIALLGLIAIAAFKLSFGDFDGERGLPGLAALFAHEWVTLVNLLGLLLGFAVVASHVEQSRLPALLPRVLPDDWKGGFVLLVLVFALSSILDNIAAALIGGTLAKAVFKDRLHVGFLAAIVGASNAGGAGSVVGDTTTTMMWIAGVAPARVLHAYVAAVPAMVFFAIVAARQQHAYQPIAKDAATGVRLDAARLLIVAVILLAAIAANVYFNLHDPALPGRVPVTGLAVWAAIALTSPIRRPDWGVLVGAARGSVFLLALVLCAAMMPVSHLPAASWPLALGLGGISAVFDNIPLTALALRHGGYDWGMLAYAVGFGGSMIWFGSSAGVALSATYPQARSAAAWLLHGWHIALGYLIGFACLLFTLGWQPVPLH